MSGIETGLDLQAALARAPEDIEAHAVRQLLLQAEPVALTAIAKRRTDKDEGHGKI